MPEFFQFLKFIELVTKRMLSYLILLKQQFQIDSDPTLPTGYSSAYFCVLKLEANVCPFAKK